MAVEIELDGKENTLVEAWQAIKYRALLNLEHGLPLDSSRVRSVLVAHDIPPSTMNFCRRYDVKSVRVSRTTVEADGLRRKRSQK